MAYGYKELTCRENECNTFVFNKGEMLCAKHYYRLLRHGGTDRHLPREAAENWESRFWMYVAKSAIDGGCDNWIGATDVYGYGVFRVQVPRRMNKKAHRIAWELAFGEIDSEKTIDHLCYNTRCVNVEHMELVSLSENAKRAAARRALNA